MIDSHSKHMAQQLEKNLVSKSETDVRQLFGTMTGDSNFSDRFWSSSEVHLSELKCLSGSL